MTATASVQIDLKKYARLLAKTLPAVIETEEENERLLREVERLMDKGEGNTTPEENKIMALMVKLIEDFEEKHYSLNLSTPLSRLESAMQERNLKPKDLWPVLGSSSQTSDVLSGRRGISKKQAKALAEFFHVSIERFI